MPAPNQLRDIRKFPDLVRYLESELEWPVEAGSFDDLTFEYVPAELGLKEEEAVAIRKIHQLRPLASGQPWGIFFVEFEKKKLPVVVLRRILSHLVIKKRASANKSDRAAWNPNDLLFISAFGDEATDQREIAFAHFHQESGDLPTLRVLGWDGGDTPLKLDYVAVELKSKLHWPADPKDQNAWRTQWSGAFRHRIGHIIRTADALAETLAALARRIRGAARTMMAHESESEPLTKLYKGFQTALIHDLKPDDFADTYAQTITYGLLTAAISRTEMSQGRHGTVLYAENVTDMVPVTNPFLKEMLQTFLKVGGRKGGIDFDELGIQDVVELLRGEETDLPAILRDFGNRNPSEDPVIRFYEDFLKKYDPEMRVKRGVFYTPQPVVSYIVRSVHELLQTEFGLEDGLASTATWGEMVEKFGGTSSTSPKLKIPDGVAPGEMFVQILDPATGTATFLVEVIDVVHRTLKTKWDKGGLKAMPKLPPTSFPRQPAAFGEYWNQYVPLALLPRLHGYELMMAPYAIAHMKIGLKLHETGYHFGTEERARIYLTNALEPKVTQLPQIGFDALAHEAAAVNEIKWYKRFTVVIGNPPYAGVSSNNSDYALRLVDAYKIIDGERLNEKKLWLQDDYVKFLRIGQMTVEQAGVGILGFITNHGYLDNPTFRGMRQSLLTSFSRHHVIDLHGNAKKKEIAPDGSPDENVFDIQQGVAVGVFLKQKATDRTNGLVYRGDLFGTRELKYAILEKASLSALAKDQLSPSSPFYLFANQNQTYRKEFEESLLLSDATLVHSVGVVTARDHLTIAFTPDEIWERVRQFTKLSEGEARAEFDLRNDVRDWKVALAQDDLRSKPLSRDFIQPILYRPFDIRFTYYTGRNKGFIGQPAAAIMANMIGHNNVGLMTTRKVEIGTFGHAICSSTMTESHSVSLKEVNYLFPLWLYPDADGLAFSKHRQPNLSADFLKRFAEILNLQQIKPHGLPDGVTPENIFHYTYGVFHSPGYRSRYAEFLRIDFPRLPLTGKVELFRALARLGGELTALHLMEFEVRSGASAERRHNSPAAPGQKPSYTQLTEYIGGKNPVVEKVSWSKNTTWLDRAETTGFKGVCENVWNFHIGGYQVCEKWLKDRKGRPLTADDRTHYQKIIIALSETIRVMAEIDAVIAQHGGWPLK